MTDAGGIAVLRAWLDAASEFAIDVPCDELRALLDEHDRMRRALEEIRRYALEGMRNASPAHRASIATIAAHALEGEPCAHCTGGRP